MQLPEQHGCPKISWLRAESYPKRQNLLSNFWNFQYVFSLTLYPDFHLPFQKFWTKYHQPHPVFQTAGTSKPVYQYIWQNLVSSFIFHLAEEVCFASGSRSSSVLFPSCAFLALNGFSRCRLWVCTFNFGSFPLALPPCWSEKRGSCCWPSFRRGGWCLGTCSRLAWGWSLLGLGCRRLAFLLRRPVQF